MEAVRVITGTGVPLVRSDVDTDQIIPSDWLKRVERTGFGAGLFSEWRENSDFVLNQERYDGAKILDDRSLNGVFVNGPRIQTARIGEALTLTLGVDGPSLLFDAVALLPSPAGASLLAREATARDFVSDAFAHLKFIAYGAAAEPLLEKAHLAPADLSPTAVILLADGHCLREQALEVCGAHLKAGMVPLQATGLDILLQMIAVRDIGKYGRAAIERHEELNGKEIDLAGDELTGPEAAKILSEVTGRTIEFYQVPIEQVREGSEDFALMLEWFDAVGYDADLTVVDLKARRTITNDWIATRAGWTPFDGTTVTGWPAVTIVRAVPPALPASSCDSWKTT